MKLLHIDSSVLGAYSVSRQLTKEIVARELALHPGTTVVYHDLAEAGTQQLSGAHLAAWQGGTVEDPVLSADLAKGAAYIDELFAADIVVIGVPMYNFSIPSQLKAWIDRITVAGKTFKYGANGPKGLLPKTTKVYLASARGGVYQPGSPAAAMEFHESYVIRLLGFIGLTDVTVVRAEGLALGPDAKAASVALALKEIEALAA